MGDEVFSDALEQIPEVHALPRHGLTCVSDEDGIGYVVALEIKLSSCTDMEPFSKPLKDVEMDVSETSRNESNAPGLHHEETHQHGSDCSE